jgi:small subunit ribosomal protein S3
MAHKAHPKSLRIKEIGSWDSRGFYEKKFSSLLEEDLKIREFLKKKTKKLGVEKIEIERSPGKINIIISTTRPGLIIGRGGGGVEELKRTLEKNVFKNKTSSSKKASKYELKIEIREVKSPWTSAPLVAQWMAEQIERRIPYRRVLKQTLEKVSSQKGVEGVKAQVAGRLNGVEIARKEWLRKGRLPRQTLRADIDYGTAKAFCTYGIIGVKVWIYKGEVFK